MPNRRRLRVCLPDLYPLALLRLTPQPILRKARLEDAAGIAETQVATWRATYRGLVPDDFLEDLSVPRQTDRWLKRFQTIPGETFVFEEQGQILAFADFGPSRDKDKEPSRVCELYAIYIRPESQGRGWGRKLFERGVSWACERGYDEITVLVLKGNLPAHGFYLRMGMKEDGTQIPINIGGRDLMEIRLAKNLDRKPFRESDGAGIRPPRE